MGTQQNSNEVIIEHFKLNNKRKNEIDNKISLDIKIDNIFVDQALKKINDLRQLHGTKNLKQDDYLNKRAYIIAKDLLNKGECFNENLHYKNFEELGMNVKMSNEKIDPEKLMEDWYKENKNYDYNNPIDFECNNFTQMIWKDSTNFGIGYYQLNNKKEKEIIDNKNEIKKIETKKKQSQYEFCYIALFYPAGNKPGKYKDNVKKEVPKTNPNNNDNNNNNLLNNLQLSNLNEKDNQKINEGNNEVVESNKNIKDIENKESKDINKSKIINKVDGKNENNTNNTTEVNELKDLKGD